jgi:hypothetical protein
VVGKPSLVIQLLAENPTNHTDSPSMDRLEEDKGRKVTADGTH